MLGLHDRQMIREKAQAPAPARSTPTRGTSRQPTTTADLELQARQSAAQQNAELKEEAAAAEEPAAPEPARGPAGRAGPLEFRSEHWEANYIQRIDATITALKSANVPVFWVGLPPLRAARASADSTYLNELDRKSVV